MEIILIILILFIILEIPTSIGMGLIFKKTNLGFTKGIIPFYNKIILIKEYKLPQYNFILIFIPLIGLYTNYLIYKEICKKYKKDKLYVLELTIFPFVFNIFLGLELKSEEKEEIDDYFENQKSLNEKQKAEEKPEIKDEYIWLPKQQIKSDTVYKASRNKLNAKVNINIKENNEIINNYKKVNQKEKEILKICPNCGAKIYKEQETCYICGTKL